MVGYNDILLGETADDTAARVIAAAELLQAGGRARHVVVESVPPPGNHLADRIAALNTTLSARAAGRSGMSFLDLTSSFMDGAARKPALFAAGVHLSAKGVRRRLRAEVAHLAGIDADLAERLRVTGGD